MAKMNWGRASQQSRGHRQGTVVVKRQKIKPRPKAAPKKQNLQGLIKSVLHNAKQRDARLAREQKKLNR